MTWSENSGPNLNHVAGKKEEVFEGHFFIDMCVHFLLCEYKVSIYKFPRLFCKKSRSRILAKYAILCLIKKIAIFRMANQENKKCLKRKFSSFPDFSDVTRGRQLVWRFHPEITRIFPPSKYASLASFFLIHLLTTRKKAIFFLK